MSTPQASVEERMAAYLEPETAAPADGAPAEKNINQRMDDYVARDEPEQEAPTAQEPAPEQPAETAEAEPETAEPEAEPEQEPEDPNSIQADQLTDLAEALELENPADLYNLRVPVNVDGKNVYKTIGELKDAQRNDEVAQSRIKAATAAKEQADAAIAQATAEIEARTQEAAQVMQYAEQQLMADFNSVDWDQLKVSNPMEWATKRQELQERSTNLQNARQQASQQYGQYLEQRNAQEMEQKQHVIERETNALLEAIPSWQKDDVRQAEQAQVRQYLLESGFQEQEVDSVLSHRVIVLANKARMYEESQRQTALAKKKVPKGVRVPLKPGARQSKADANQGKVQALRKRLKGSGRLEDAFELYQEINKE